MNLNFLRCNSNATILISTTTVLSLLYTEYTMLFSCYRPPAILHRVKGMKVKIMLLNNDGLIYKRGAIDYDNENP